MNQGQIDTGPFFFFCHNCDHAAIFLQYMVSKTRMFFSFEFEV